MQSLSDDERNQVLVVGEVLADELKAIHELVKDVPTIKNDVHALKQDVEELKSDMMKIVKAAITDISKQQNDQERRISPLEAA